MESEKFDLIINESIEQIKHTLLVKSKEYRRNNNVYHNFDEGAKITGQTPEKVLYGFLLKHLISVADIRDDIDLGILPTLEKVEEKYNDILVYTLIEKAMIIQRIKNQSNDK